MGASSTGPKSNRRGDTDEGQNNNNQQQPQVIVPRLSIQDVENNNSHIFVNPQESDLNFLPIHALMDECDLLNNNTTLINNNYLTVSLTSPSSTALTTTYSQLNKKQTFYQLSSERPVPTANNRKDKMPKDSPKKSPKKKLDEKSSKEKDKKKKKEKPKAPRAPTGGGPGGGGGRNRGMSDQEMMRRPRRKTSTKPEK